MNCDTCGIECTDALDLEAWTCAECAILCDIVWNALAVARSIGVPHYGPSSWRDVSITEHLEHASKHIYQERKFYTDNAEEEDHLAHAICRLAMAKALQSG